MLIFSYWQIKCLMLTKKKNKKNTLSKIKTGK